MSYVLRDFSMLGELATAGGACKRGDALAAIQFDISKEGKATAAFDAALMPKSTNGKAVTAIPTKNRAANVRAIIRPQHTKELSRIVIAHKSAIKNPQFHTLDPILARLVFGDSGLVVKNDPLGRFMHTFAGRAGKMMPFATTRSGPCEPIDSPEGSENAEFTATEDMLIAVNGTSTIWAVPFDMIEEARQLRRPTPWAPAYKGTSQFAWASRPLPGGGFVFGTYGAGEVQARMNGMCAQGFQPSTNNGRFALLPMTDEIASGGKNAVAFDGLTCGETAKELYAVFRPLTGETSHESPVHVVKALTELDPAWDGIIESLIHPN